jgi:indolepyruvate ferredoxin oxidoreductase
MLSAFRALARLRWLRGTPFDIFGRTAERRRERRSIADYEAQLAEISAGLSAANHAIAVELAAVPLDIRGFGHVKEANLRRAEATAESLIARFRSPPGPQAIAAE